jgi:UDP-N-acetylmuramyl pentapeptide synthase
MSRRRPAIADPPPVQAGAAIRPLDRSPAQLAYYLAKRLALPLVRAHRRRLRDTLVVAVTGSAGKTSAVDLAAAVLGGPEAGTSSQRSSNRAQGLIDVLRATRRHHRFTVVETAAWGPGTLDELLWALEPRVGIVTAVGREHHKTFRSVEEVAREKAKLVQALPADGLALLNGDDPRVRAMAGAGRARTVLFGRGDDIDVRAEEVVARWPRTLSLVAVRGGVRLPLTTRFVGEHWLPSVLAAVALGLETGVAPDQVAAAIAAVEPQTGRLSEHRTPAGVTFLDDAFKAPTWSLEQAFEVLRTAEAERRVLVLGQLSDDSHKPRDLFRRLAPRALAAADLVVMVGRWARYADEPAAAADDLHLCADLREADRLLDDLLRPGDLVLLKGTRSSDHLERLVLSRGGGIACWRMACGRLPTCDRCRLRWRPEGGPPTAAPPR